MLALIERTRTDMAGSRVTKMLGQSLYFFTIDKSDLPDDQKRQQKGLDYTEVKIERDLLRVERALYHPSLNRFASTSVSIFQF